MGKHPFGKITFDPATNPAILDTLTWDVDAVRGVISSAGSVYWDRATKALRSNGAAPPAHGLVLHESSAARREESIFILCECDDGQHFIARLGGRGRDDAAPFHTVDGDACLAFYAADSRTLHSLFAAAAPARLPAAMGSVPRLGIGTRMSRLCFPGIWAAVRRRGFAANVIQNSCRELNTLANILDARPSRSLYYPGFGFVSEGHTGSTFEGLWTCGVAESLKHGNGACYGADADHIMVKRGPEGIEAAPYYSFYTLDVSDLLDYDAQSSPQARGNGAIRRDQGSWHAEERRIGEMRFSLGTEELSRLRGKYDAAMDAVESLARHIGAVHRGEPFDLELSVDEHPPEVPAFDCMTGDTEMFFLLSEARRRGIPLTHVAPNVGVEKLLDYRHADGLPGLKARVGRLDEIARHFNVILDIHSGDDLSPATRAALREATGGHLHFKVSPGLQVLLGEAAFEREPDFFREWWADAVASAEESARKGSDYARACLAQSASDPSGAPDPGSDLFKGYCFAAVGRRDAGGRFLLRDRFYSLSPECRALYDQKVADWICGLAADLFGAPAITDATEQHGPTLYADSFCARRNV